MTHQGGVRWRCPDPDCRWSMVVTSALPGEPAPRCICGNAMQKAEPAPHTMAYLDFLRAENRGPEEPAEKE